MDNNALRSHSSKYPFLFIFPSPRTSSSFQQIPLWLSSLLMLFLSCPISFNWSFLHEHEWRGYLLKQGQLIIGYTLEENHKHHSLLLHQWLSTYISTRCIGPSEPMPHPWWCVGKLLLCASLASQKLICHDLCCPQQYSAGERETCICLLLQKREPSSLLSGMPVVICFIEKMKQWRKWVHPSRKWGQGKWVSEWTACYVNRRT